MSERTIAIRVDEELFKKIKVRLADNGMTLKDYVISLIKEDLKRDASFDSNAIPVSKTISEKDLQEAQKVLDFVGDLFKGKYGKE